MTNWKCDIARAGERFRSGSLTCERLTRSCLEGIHSLDPTLHAFISVCEDAAIETARTRDHELAAGFDRGPLHGIPIVYKDNMDTAGIRTTVGSQLLADRVPGSDAELVEVLSAAGAVTLGKTNMNEFAAGGPGGYNKFFGSTRNPWNIEHESGGSSSGTGAAVASGLCLGGMGSDSGGSIRGPAAHMGIVGVRPTFGRISTTGVFPRARSLDTCGPMTRTVTDAALFLEVLLDGTSLVDLSEPASRRSLRGTKIGLISGYVAQNVDAEVMAAFRSALATLADLDAEVINLTLPDLERGFIAEMAANLLVYEFKQIFDEIYSKVRDSEHIGPVVHRDMAKASTITGAEYKEIVRIREGFSAKLQALFKMVDVVVTPTMPTTAPPIVRPDLSGRHRQFTIPFSFVGHPACSVPCGFSLRGLPIGLQFVAGKFEEMRLLQIALVYERAAAASRRKPMHYFSLPIE